MSKTYSISELASEFDVTTRSIRFYEDQELLHPTRRGQTRIYSSKDRVRLKLTLRGKRLGFSLAEIRELFELWDTDQSGTLDKAELQHAGVNTHVFTHEEPHGTALRAGCLSKALLASTLILTYHDAVHPVLLQLRAATLRALAHGGVALRVQL